MQVKYICKDVYTVQSGDTLYTISQNFNVHLGLLMRVNRIINPYNLRIGTRLCIPVPVEEEEKPATRPERPATRPKRPATKPERPATKPERPATRPLPPPAPSCDGTMYTIVRGDTLYMIAKKKGISLKQIMDANPDIDPYNMMVGDRICIPE